MSHKPQPVQRPGGPGELFAFCFRVKENGNVDVHEWAYNITRAWLDAILPLAPKTLTSTILSSLSFSSPTYSFLVLSEVAKSGKTLSKP